MQIEGGAIPRRPGHGNGRGQGGVLPAGVGELGQIPAVALAEEAAVVQWPADRVGRVLAAGIPLHLPGNRAGRTAERRGNQAAPLLLRVVDALVGLRAAGAGELVLDLFEDHRAGAVGELVAAKYPVDRGHPLVRRRWLGNRNGWNFPDQTKVRLPSIDKE